MYKIYISICYIHACKYVIHILYIYIHAWYLQNCPGGGREEVENEFQRLQRACHGFKGRKLLVMSRRSSNPR